MAYGKLTGLMTAAALTGLWTVPSLAQTRVEASSSDLSPTLLIETGPSDNPDYRRMVFVKYLNEETVSVAYVAYNRTEFIQVPSNTPDALIAACQNGAATTLEQIQTYHDQEAARRAASEPPAIEHFCIKNVADWEAGNRSLYLDSIFDGLPHAAALNN